MRTYCHNYGINSGIFPLLHPQMCEYAIQHITADQEIHPLGCQNRSVRVVKCVTWGVHSFYSDRAKNTVASDRRRQTCRSSKCFWPLACSLQLQLAHSRKSQWKSLWLWKKKPWRSSKLLNFRPGASGARPDSIWRLSCQFSKYLLPLVFSLPSQLALSRKKKSWKMTPWLWKKNPQPSTKSLCEGALRALHALSLNGLAMEQGRC